MKTCTLLICLLFLVNASYATVMEGGYPGKPIDIDLINSPNHVPGKVEPFSVCLEAENSNGTSPVTDDPNASNGKTRGDQNNWDHYVEYAVNGVLAAGEHQLTIRYYAVGDATVSISVNGVMKVPVGCAACNPLLEHRVGRANHSYKPQQR
jgi:hypothetical protein